MSEREIVIKETKLRFVGIVDLSDLYRKLKWWLDFNGYGDEFKNFKEEKYVERIKPEGKQVEIRWVCKKDVSDYFVNLFEITFLVIGYQKIEIEKEGKKVEAYKGDVEIKFSVYLLTNAKDKWDDNSWMNRIYKKYVAKSRVDAYKIDLYEKAQSFYEEIKNYLALQKG